MKSGQLANNFAIGCAILARLLSGMENELLVARRRDRVLEEKQILLFLEKKQSSLLYATRLNS
jgi:hypothetical protein